jgi:NADPH:quinone reductase
MPSARSSASPGWSGYGPTALTLARNAVIRPGEQVLVTGAATDVILDGVGGRIGQDAFTVIAPGGRFSAHGAPSGSFAQIDPADLPPLVEQALAEVSAGQIEPVIGQSFPLIEAAPGAPQHRVPRHAGKTLLLP